MRFREKIARRKTGAGVFRLTPEKLIRPYLALIGHVPDNPWKTVDDYLAMGRDLSAMAYDRYDRNKIDMVLWSVFARAISTLKKPSMTVS
ncbi:MAG: hypothetical protein LBR80_15205 [Deltaproteobacteria bacterium]|nr:hypothetical protein [Deltaproteobacteria bacterium]